MKEAYVPIETVAKHFAVSISTVRAWLRTKKIPSNTFIQVGSTYRFNLTAVEEGLLGDTQENILWEPDKDFHGVEGDQMCEQLELDLDDDA